MSGRNEAASMGAGGGGGARGPSGFGVQPQFWHYQQNLRQNVAAHQNSLNSLDQLCCMQQQQLAMQQTRATAYQYVDTGGAALRRRGEEAGTTEQEPPEPPLPPILAAVWWIETTVWRAIDWFVALYRPQPIREPS